MQNVTNWGDSVKERREALHLSPDRLGAILGVNGESVRRWERNLLPRPATMAKVDEILDRMMADRPEGLSDQVSALRREVAEVRELVQRDHELLEALIAQLRAANTSSRKR
jgi:transcriptional regulator with XRE-family HTH domain